MDVVTREKWDRAAANFDLMAGYGPEKRWRPAKHEFFARMGEGRILFLAVGTGLDIQFFPEGRSIFAHTIAYYEMAYNLAEMEEDLDQALDYARKSVELSPEEFKQFPLAALGCAALRIVL